MAKGDFFAEERTHGDEAKVLVREYRQRDVVFKLVWPLDRLTPKGATSHKAVVC